MKYTRIDLKRKRSKGSFFVFLILGILALAFISGSIISKLVIREININNNTKSVSESDGNRVEQNIQEDVSSNEYVIIQCGVFSGRVNAETLKNKLSFAKTPLIIEEGDKYKVILGVFSKTEAEEMIKKLEGNKIEFSKKIIKINKSDLCNLQISEIINARLQIINKFSDEKVKSVQTKQIKDWIASLKDYNEKSNNYSLLMELMEDTKKLPENLIENDMEKQVGFIYKILVLMK